METAIKKPPTLTELIAFDKAKAPVMTDLMKKVDSAVLASQAEVKQVTNRAESVACDSQTGIMKAITKRLEDKRLEHSRIVTNFKNANNDWYYTIIGPLKDETKRLLAMAQEYLDKCAAERLEEERKRQAEIDKREKIQEAHKQQGHEIDETPRAELVPQVETIKEKTAARTMTRWVIGEVINLSLVDFSLLSNEAVRSIVRQEAQKVVNAHIKNLRNQKIEPSEENMIKIPGCVVKSVTKVI